MPGFTNYKPSTPDEAVSPITRKYYIENINFEDLNKMPVTLPDMPEQMQKAMEEAQNRNIESHRTISPQLPNNNGLNSDKLQ
jgi:hypothetical protein